LKGLGISQPFAVAVSGGADSVAVMRLAIDWCHSQGIEKPVILTVDHGLRPGSASEAARVGEWAKALGVPHSVLRWTGPRPRSNIQALAREARYRLLASAMSKRGISLLLTGHNLDDQAENFLIRLARGSGLEGLAGMSPRAAFPLAGLQGMTLVRPALAFPHQRLVATLKACGQAWIDDPSNTNDRFQRVKIRALAPALSAAGITPERIAGAAAHLRRAQDASAAAIARLRQEAVDVSPFGYAMLRTAPFVAAPRDHGLRLLSRLLAMIGGNAYPPRLELAEAACDWIAGGGPPRGRTVAGCRLSRRADGLVLLAREETALLRANPAVDLVPGAAIIWDGKWEVTAPEGSGRVHVAALGPAGLKSLGKQVRLPEIEPHRIAMALPAIWRGKRLISAPLLDFHPEWAARVRLFQAPDSGTG